MASGDDPNVQMVAWFGSSVKYASNRDAYKLKNIPKKYQSMAYLQGDSDKHFGTTLISVDVPVTVYAVVDGRPSNPIAPDGFTKSGETIEFTHSSDTVPFQIYSRDYEAGNVHITFSGGSTGSKAVMANFFLERRCQGLSQRHCLLTAMIMVHPPAVPLPPPVAIVFALYNGHVVFHGGGGWRTVQFSGRPMLRDPGKPRVFFFFRHSGLPPNCMQEAAESTQ